MRLHTLFAGLPQKHTKIGVSLTAPCSSCTSHRIATEQRTSGESRDKLKAMVQKQLRSIQSLASPANEQGQKVDLFRAIEALQRMRSTVGMLGHVVVREEAATAQHRTFSLLETTVSSKRQRLEDPENATVESGASHGKTDVATSEKRDNIDNQWMTIMAQTIRAERLSLIFHDLNDLQEKLILTMEECAVDRYTSGPGRQP